MVVLLELRNEGMSKISWRRNHKVLELFFCVAGTPVGRRLLFGIGCVEVGNKNEDKTIIPRPFRTNFPELIFFKMTTAANL